MVVSGGPLAGHVPAGEVRDLAHATRRAPRRERTVDRRQSDPGPMATRDTKELRRVERRLAELVEGAFERLSLTRPWRSLRMNLIHRKRIL